MNKFLSQTKLFSFPRPKGASGALLVSMFAIAILTLAIHSESANAHSLLHDDNSIHRNNNEDSNANNNLDNVEINPHPNGHSKAANYHQNGYRSRCAAGWTGLNNKCWLATKSRRDFQKAGEICRKNNNSTLPTINSAEENDFLRRNINLENSPIWLGALHNHQYNVTRWISDKNVTATYTNWDQGQPNDKSSLVCIRTDDGWFMRKSGTSHGQTECVSFWEDGKWGTQVGCNVLLPVVCEKKLSPSPQIPKYQIAGQNQSDQLLGEAPALVNAGSSNTISSDYIMKSLSTSCLLAIFLSCFVYYQNK